MKFPLSSAVLVAAGLFAHIAPALSHVSFETPEAAQNKTYKAILRVPHGCAGQPTLSVRVSIPDGVVDVSPMPKAGWTLETVKAAAAPSSAAQPAAKAVREIVWTGSLQDEHFDEFTFRARITEVVPSGTDLAFPVVQTCATASEAWTEIARPGQDAHALKRPAPTVKVVGSEAEQSVSSGNITVMQPWSRATPAGARVGGGYLRITNTGKEPDRLLGGTFPLAAKVELHEMSLSENVMRMKQVSGGLEIKPGETVELKPGGYHLMFVDLREGLKDGQSIAGTLDFEKAGPITISYRVRSMSGAPSAHQH